MWHIHPCRCVNAFHAGSGAITFDGPKRLLGANRGDAILTHQMEARRQRNPGSQHTWGGELVSPQVALITATGSKDSRKLDAGGYDMQVGPRNCVKRGVGAARVRRA